jgi:hypothetical protein
MAPRNNTAVGEKAGKLVVAGNSHRSRCHGDGTSRACTHVGEHQLASRLPAITANDPNLDMSRTGRDKRIRRGGVLFAGLCVLASEFGTSAAAADANNGKRIARMRCSPCHIVVPNQRQEVAKSPPFEDIARQNGFNAEMLAYLILAPHPRMNLAFTREEADDLAAYIASLRR